jgi:hypothetical protein
MRRRCACEEPHARVKRGVRRSPKFGKHDQNSLSHFKEGSAHSGFVIQDLLPHISVTDHARDCNHASQHANTLDALRDLDPDGVEYVV